jgi:hypothetical protein
MKLPANCALRFANSTLRTVYSFSEITLAESPNRKVKTERKQRISEVLNISPQQVERLLNQYHEDALCETAGVQRSDNGKHRTDDCRRTIQQIMSLRKLGMFVAYPCNTFSRMVEKI